MPISGRAVMDQSEFMKEIGGAGQFARVTWESIVKTPAKSSDLVVKRSTATVRAGIAYANLAQNEDTETGGLPWGEWSEFPYVITHKGQTYFRLYLSDGWKVNQTFTINGEPATKEQAQSVTLPSAWSKSNGEPVKTFTVKAEGVISIGKGVN